MIHTIMKLLVLLRTQVRIGLKRKKREEVITIFSMMLVHFGTSSDFVQIVSPNNWYILSEKLILQLYLSR